jgi:hypothetical protein
VREDLLDYAAQWVDWYQHADRALAARRIVYDGHANPALQELHHNLIVRPRTEAARDITRRAIKHGQVAPTVRSSTIVDLLVGAMSTHWEMTPEPGRAHLRLTFPAFAESLVDIILAGVQVASGSATLVPAAVHDTPVASQSRRPRKRG